MAAKQVIRSIGLVVRQDRSAQALHLAADLATWLKAQGLVALGEPLTAHEIGAVAAEPAELAQKADLIVVLGGDGTLLGAARLIGKRETPILGINLGGLGFLTEITVDEARATLARVISGDFEVDRRITLEAVVERGDARGNAEHFRALNDIVIVETFARQDA